MIVLAPKACPFQKHFYENSFDLATQNYLKLHAPGRKFTLCPIRQKLQWKPIHIVMRHRLICPANLFRLSSICHNSITPLFNSSRNEKKVYRHAMQCQYLLYHANAELRTVCRWCKKCHFCLSAETAVQLLHYIHKSVPIMADTWQWKVSLVSRGDLLLYTWHGNA